MNESQRRKGARVPGQSEEIGEGHVHNGLGMVKLCMEECRYKLDSLGERKDHSRKLW